MLNYELPNYCGEDSNVVSSEMGWMALVADPILDDQGSILHFTSATTFSESI